MSACAVLDIGWSFPALLEEKRRDIGTDCLFSTDRDMKKLVQRILLIPVIITEEQRSILSERTVFSLESVQKILEVEKVYNQFCFVKGLARKMPLAQAFLTDLSAAKTVREIERLMCEWLGNHEVKTALRSLKEVNFHNIGFTCIPEEFVFLENCRVIDLTDNPLYDDVLDRGWQTTIFSWMNHLKRIRCDSHFQREMPPRSKYHVIETRHLFKKKESLIS